MPYTGLSLDELWLKYFTLGGQAGEFEVEAYLHGAMSLPDLQRDILAHAVNERLDALNSPAPRAPYSTPDPGKTDEGSGPEQSP